jgi:phosphoribosylformimino-5-aminoimidazole carboxamide ribotide isomerase
VEIIPVIDLLGGQVVHARRGQRERYQPERSTLCSTSTPIAIARALLELYPFKSLYIADLDAIQGAGSQLEVITRLRQQIPHINLWLDAGVTRPAQLLALRERGMTGVIGSERLQSLAQYQHLVEAEHGDAVLSLDFGNAGFLGPPELLQNPQLWPARLICMTLTRVGSAIGADTVKLRQLLKMAAPRQLYAAGGIRGEADLHGLAKLGLQGALLATALHSGTVSTPQLAALMALKTQADSLGCCLQANYFLA